LSKDESVDIPKPAAISELWKRSEIYWKLKPNQSKIMDLIHDLIRSREHRKFIIHCSRRFGKSFILCLLSVVVCMKVPSANVRYASATQKSVRKMIKPIIKIILKDCPEELKPKWNQSDGCYKFLNGSELHIAGVNNGHEDDLRGTAAHLAIVDEAAFVDNLSYVVESVLMPQLITTDGLLLMASSSPLSPAHEFAEYIHKAESEGNYASFDIYDADYPEKIIEEFMKEAGGAESTTWKREYLNELIVDEEFQIIPEFDPASHVVDVPRDEYFKYYRPYDSMDTGFKDNTAILFSYYDFKYARLIVEDEFIINGKDVTSERIATEVKSKEKSLEYKEAHRIADNNDPIFLNDLQYSQDITFFPTNKDSLHAMVNELRMWIKSGRLLIHPRCKNLIGCLEYGVWNKSKKEFDRSKTYGHYDALAALIYLVRNIDVQTNPIPITHNTTFDHHVPEEEEQGTEVWRKLFNK
jgi:hypothetical protein